jgi:carboxymethylenebutenolidase
MTEAERAERSKGLDTILAAEVPLGSDEWRVRRLAQSHRHHATVSVKGSTRTHQAFIVYPLTSRRVPVVLMVPEDQGVNNWARDMADQIAAMGYLVIVPDVLAGYGPLGGGRDSFPDLKSAMMVLGTLKEESMLNDLNVWADYGKQLSQCDGQLQVVGFAWGGGRAFAFAAQRKDLAATYVFYDWAPPGTSYAGITAPLYGFHAETDTRVITTLAATKAGMAAAGKRYESIVYPGADHMFVRLGEEPGDANPANIEARARALSRLQELLRSTAAEARNVR